MPTRSAISALELIIPPPVVTLIVGVLMWLASSMAHFSEFTVPGRTRFATCLSLTGLIVSALAFVAFRRARTTVNPTRPSATTSLVVVGVYGFTRNPMCLGLLLVLLGWAIFLSNAVAFAIVPVFVLYMNRFQIAPEERALALKFGQQYVAYKARVRQWL